MRLRHIELINAVLRTGSLTQAANLLHITQPAASKILAHAEAQLGFSLFRRIKGRLHATPELDILTPHIARLNQDMASVRRLAENIKRHPQGHLRVGCAPAIGLGLLPQAIRHSRERQPGVVFDVHTYHSAELVERLHVRELDLAVTFDAADHPGMDKTPVGQTELVCLSAGESADCAGKAISLEELASRELIMLDMHDRAGALLDDALSSAGLGMRPNIQVQTHYVACALAQAGCGDTVVDAITARAMLRPGNVLRPLDPPIPVPINVITHGSVPRREIDLLFIDQLRRLCRALAALSYAG
ncbi:LysR family transcriptional regulator [Parapusillimonas granuli]|uniref:LysR family transcriptional regulator n=1 Tax=Parapusillimonas granuli TaxID=380911 RepID=A0A853G4I3_9BURK|nr:LysR substrate-binding domain-containing protein [Parapusillimonas granuli]MBB5215970.1 DNA-binding transcriptional LysR family regulator [Parapusillimonas granuli]MEB2399347.1 LysR substrate-binding domain-containing protein [Alcaligenaceae bacterium]NYT50732.1 LysR family transcriptional regulator [Parapusillimonas granuli]